MRELDLLLESFLASELKSLTEDDLDCLEYLLEQPDQDILAWLTSEAKPENAQMLRIVKTLRKHVRPRPGTDD